MRTTRPQSPASEPLSGLSLANVVARMRGACDSSAGRLALLGLALVSLMAIGATAAPVFGAPVAADLAPEAFSVHAPSAVDGVDVTMAVTTTSTTITSMSPNPAVVGQGVTVVVSVAATGPTTPSSPAISGSVTVSNGTGNTCMITLPATSCVLTSTTAGTKSVTATYSGDATYFGSTSPIANLIVNKADTTTTLASSAGSSTHCTTVYFTATVTVDSPGSGTAAGNVLFKDGAVTIGAGTLNGSGQAFFNSSTLSVGNHSISASYQGNANFNASDSSISIHTVTKGSVTVTLADGPDPSAWGQYVVLTATVTSSPPGCATAPSGLVTFRDGGIPIDSAFIDGSGIATIAVCNLSVGSHSLVAHYGGDSTFNVADSASQSHTVNKDDTITNLSSSVNPSVWGQVITLNANVVGVSPCSGTPVGTVTFKDGATTLSTQSLSGGAGSYTFNTLTVGSHSLTAVYNGSSQHNTSTSTILTQVVNKADTSTSLGSSTNPAVYGQTINLSSFVQPVSPGAGNPSGTVDFKNLTDATTLCSVSGMSWTCNVSNLPVGTKTLRADYGGDSNFNGSTSSTLSQVVNKADTVTTIVDQVNPTVFGQSTTFTATVSVVAPGSGTRTGTVQFKDGASNLGAPVAINASFKAALTISTLSIGAHSITAVYSGDSNFNGSTSAATTHTVNKANTTVVVSSSPNPSANGQNVTITANVTVDSPGSGSPTGTVTFKDGPNTIGTGTIAAGVATMMISTLTVGAHLLTAVYPGDSNFNGNTSAPYTHNVGVAATGTTITQNSTTTVYGQSVMFTANVTSTGGTPTGTVTFKDGSTAIGTSNLSAGTATLNYSLLNAGAHGMKAVYNGDANNSSSTSSVITHTVTAAGTSTTIASSGSPTVFGQTVYFSATVTVTPPGGGVPAGNVDFKDGATTLATVMLDGSGMAYFSTSSLAVGGHSMTAAYGGSSNHTSSTSASLPHTVTKADTSTAVVSSLNPSAFGDSVTFTATVTPVAPGSGTPTGTVQFKDGASNLGGPVSLAGGMASFTTSSLILGSHNITAVYNGDANFNVSTSPILVQVVQAVIGQIDLSIVKTDSPDPVRAGDPVTYLISVTNNSSSTASATVTDTLPSLVSYASHSAPGWSCSTPAGQVVCSRSIGAGATETFSIIVNVPGTLAAGTVLENTAVVVGPSGTVDPNPDNNTATARTTVYRTRRFAVTFD